MENGEPVIIKSDLFQKDTTPSCVAINKKQIVSAGDVAYGARGRSISKMLNDPGSSRDDTFVEFKRTMGTDAEYKSVHLGRSLSSEELSAQVLKKLKSYVTDEVVHCAVITVPAKFRQTQINATQKAAELAGFAHCELLQEPTAASIAYSIKATDMEGRWLVFDFGNGTFDASLMETDDGVMNLIDTESDNLLDGKDLDFAIVDEILIPHLEAKYSIDSLVQHQVRKDMLRRYLTKFAKETRVALSSGESHAIFETNIIDEDDEGEEVDLDLMIPLSQYEAVVEPIFQKAVDICLALLKRHSLKGADLKTVVFVGGPTFQQTCRRMVAEQLGCSVDTSVDPITAVAAGATIFASTRPIPRNLQVKDTARVQLKVDAPGSTVEMEEPITVIVDRNATEWTLPDELFVEIANADRSWSSGRTKLDNDSEVIFAQLNEGTTNTFTIRIFDKRGNEFPVQPSSCSILQGIKVAEATLPYHVMLARKNIQTGQEETYAIPWLEKNNNLPARGKFAVKTQRDIRPGNNSDTVDIILYEGEYDQVGINPKLCKLVAKGQINGNDISDLIPANSDIEFIVKVDSSRRVTISAYIECQDKDIDVKCSFAD
jgi:molecular chaperone DnaK